MFILFLKMVKKSNRSKKNKEKGTSHKVYYYVFGILLLLFLIWFLFIQMQVTSPVDNNFTRESPRFFYNDSESNASQFEPQIIDPKAPIQLPGGGGGGKIILTPSPILPGENVSNNSLIMGFDSDGGINYLSKGECFDFVINFSSTDECVDNQFLAELAYQTFINKQGETLSGCFWMDLKDCSEFGNYGCVDGACVDIIAKDTEKKLLDINPEGYNYLTNGSCTDYSGTYVDYCYNEELLVEYAIVENACVPLDIFCPDGCVGGACIPWDTIEEDPNPPEYIEQTCPEICSIMDFDGYAEAGDNEENCNLLEGLTSATTEYINNCCCYKESNYSESTPEVEQTCDSFCKTIVNAYSFGTLYSSGECKIGRGTGSSLCSSYGGIYISDGDQFCASTGRCCCFE
jgi:hypothetical protein